MRVWPVADKAIHEGKVKIDGQDAIHITKVLRLGIGDSLRVSDSSSQLYGAKIVAINKKSLVAKITGKIKTKPNKPDVSLAVALNKPSVMELVVQKAVELGCLRVMPVITERTTFKSLSPAKLARLRRIAHEASKQCGNVKPMEVASAIRTDEIPDADLKIVLWESEKKVSLKTVLEKYKKVSSVTLLVGPPGGFAPSEIVELKERGFITAGMGDLILRSETAAISLLSVVNYHFGKFS